MKFTKEECEYTDLHLLYGETRGNSRTARRLQHERFPEGVLPFRCTFVELYLRLCEADSDWFNTIAYPILDLTPLDFDF
jgi:hypothetical protein